LTASASARSRRYRARSKADTPSWSRVIARDGSPSTRAPTRSTSPVSIAANRSSDALAIAKPSHYRLYLLSLNKHDPNSEMAARRTSPSREVEAVAERLHSAALLPLRRLRTEGDARRLSPPRLSALCVVVHAGPIGLGALEAAQLL